MKAKARSPEGAAYTPPDDREDPAQPPLLEVARGAGPARITRPSPRDRRLPGHALVAGRVADAAAPTGRAGARDGARGRGRVPRARPVRARAQRRPVAAGGGGPPAAAAASHRRGRGSRADRPAAGAARRLVAVSGRSLSP